MSLTWTQRIILSDYFLMHTQSKPTAQELEARGFVRNHDHQLWIKPLPHSEATRKFVIRLTQEFLCLPP